jgi:hypothetical protein
MSIDFGQLIPSIPSFAAAQTRPTKARSPGMHPTCSHIIATETE